MKYFLSNYINTYIGQWFILGYSHKTNEHYWKVRCSCGIEESRRVSQLVKGLTKSCRSCCATKQPAEYSPYWKSTSKISCQYLNRLSFRHKVVSITMDDLIIQWTKQNGLCAYTGVPLVLMNRDKTKTESTASIDRIDSNLGYHKDNIHWVHKQINFMKLNLTHEDFIYWCKKVNNWIT